MDAMALTHVHRFTTEQFLAMDGLPERVELIDGVICDMASEYNPHAFAQEAILRALLSALPSWHVVAGGSIRVTDSFCPIPDVAVYAADVAHGGIFDGRDVRLAVEVGLSTASSDRMVKLPAYAAGKVEEVWLVAPDEQRLTLFRVPSDGRYTEECDLSWPTGLDQAVASLVARLEGPS